MKIKLLKLVFNMFLKKNRLIAYLFTTEENRRWRIIKNLVIIMIL